MEKAKLQERYQLFIGGQWKDASAHETFKTICPADGSVLAECAQATKEDVDEAVKAAWEAFKTWKHTTVAERAAVLNKIAAIIDENKEHLAMVESMDNGKPIRETLAVDIPMAADHFRYFAGCIRQKRKCQYSWQRHLKPDLKRTDRRSRPDRSMELPIFNGSMETGSCSCQRLLYCI